LPRFRHDFLRWHLVLAIIILPGWVGRAEEPPAAKTDKADDSAPKDEHAEARMKYMLKAMQKYTVVVDGDETSKATLDAKALVRWSNPIADVVDGLLTVYTQGPADRPAMIAHFYVHGPLLNGLEMHEFAEIHPGKVELIRGQTRVWVPGERYTRFQELPGAPQPSEKAALRIAQIKSMAARFEIIDGYHFATEKPQPQPLRMMARPTYRYGEADGELVDGVLFTYVLATDPEACLLIEIHRNDGKYTWHYAVFPLTIYSLEARLDRKTVWEKPEAMVFGNPTAPHYISPYRGDPGEPTMQALAPVAEP
jgi:hypothetical protein